MYDFIRVAVAVPLVNVGDISFNSSQIIKNASKAQEHNVDLLVFPELSLTGYSCGDLFFQSCLYSEINKAIAEIVKASHDWNFAFAIGAPLIIGNQLYNCAVIILKGKVQGIVPKTFLPIHNEFFEKRWFSSSLDLKIEKVSSSILGISEEYDIPIGRDLIFNINSKINLGVEICEDLWSPIPPSSFLTLGGAEIILNLSASAETVGKRSYRSELVKQQSAKCLCGYVYCSAGSTESTTDLVFSGHSIIAENGSLLKENENLIQTDYILISDMDLGKIRADRARNKTFKDSAMFYANGSCRMVYCNFDKEVSSNGEIYPIERLPFVPSSKDILTNRCMDIFQMQVSGLKKRISTIDSKVVIGISGGIDSTLALLVCVEAMRQLERPLTDVIGITMPGFGTSGRTYQNAINLMKSLKITSIEIDIKKACIQHFNDIGHDINTHDITFENVQARERTQVLMDYAGKVGAFVIGTGDLSELALGWCTYNADHMSMYAVNSCVPKTLIRWIIINSANLDIFTSSADILKDIVDTPISPELLPADSEGKILQETESVIGPYELHDFFLYYMMRFGFSPDKIFYLAKRAFKDAYDDETILKWMRVFYTRFFSQQFKRSCMPDGVKIGSICLSPRSGWKMPSDASAAIWLKIIESIRPNFT